jgi:tetrahydromethanopterin:alpha-L-glutamate ligase
MSKHIGIAVTNPSDWTVTSFIKNLKERGVKPEIIRLHRATSDIEHITCEGVNLFNLDALLVRDVGSGGLEEAAFRFDLLLELEHSGIPVINPPSTIQLAANKHLSYWKLKRAGVPLPETLVTSDVKKAEDFVRKTGCLVAKPIFGYKGKDVELIKEQTLHRIGEIISQRGVIYLQEFIAHGGKDIRAFVVNNSVVGAVYRVAPEGEWVSNLSQGGTPQPCTLTQTQKNMAIKAATTLGAVYAGVDLIEDENNTYVLEINATPSGYGLYSTYGIDVGKHIIDAVFERLYRSENG